MTLPGIPFQHALGDGGVRSTTQVVVIHATDNTASAANEAAYATRRADQTSAHFYVDGSSVYQALRLDHVAYGCLYHGNMISIQFELCGRSNQISDATMRKAAPIVAEVCRRYSIPVRKISPSQVAAGTKGICGHLDITKAFPQDHGTHTDPGASFPWSKFIEYVNEGADMPLTSADVKTVWKTDNVIPAPTRYADSDNKFWTAASYLQNLDDWAYGTYNHVKALETSVATLTRLVQSLADPTALVAKLAPALAAALQAAGVGSTVTDAQLQDALRAVLGSLDEQPTT